MNDVRFKEEGFQGLRDAMPIMIAYFPLAMTFGVVAASGLSPFLTILSSVWVYSGGGQFMIASMVGTFIAPITIMMTVLLVNMRHILYGTTLGPYMRDWKPATKAIAALGLTDEIFALISSKVRTEQQLSAPYYICFAMPSYISWILGTIAGVAVGSFVPSELADILSFTLPALFLALLFIGEKTISYILSASVGAVVAIIMNMIGLGGVGLILGGLVGATSGYLYHQKQKSTA